LLTEQELIYTELDNPRRQIVNRYAFTSKVVCDWPSELPKWVFDHIWSRSNLDLWPQYV